MKHSIIYKYRHPQNCKLPFDENDALMYCWGFAGIVDKMGRRKAIKECKSGFCGKCEYNRETK
jgi:hypothetical protein